jgi:hypothetical protein
MSKHKTFLIVLMTLALGVFMTLPANAQDEAVSPPEEIHQMDWFVGEWEVESRYLIDPEADEWIEESVVSTVSPIIGGFALLETFTGSLGGAPIDAISVRTYNTNLGKWEQRWLDNTNATGFAEYTGEWNDETGEFIAYSNRSFTPEDEGGRGENNGAREVFFDIEDDRFSWRWETSNDDGETWTVLWTLEYTRVG